MNQRVEKNIEIYAEHLKQSAEYMKGTKQKSQSEQIPTNNKPSHETPKQKNSSSYEKIPHLSSRKKSHQSVTTALLNEPSKKHSMYHQSSRYKNYDHYIQTQLQQCAQKEEQHEDERQRLEIIEQATTQFNLKQAKISLQTKQQFIKQSIPSFINKRKYHSFAATLGQDNSGNNQNFKIQTQLNNLSSIYWNIVNHLQENIKQQEQQLNSKIDENRFKQSKINQLQGVVKKIKEDNEQLLQDKKSKIQNLQRGISNLESYITQQQKKTNQLKREFEAEIRENNQAFTEKIKALNATIQQHITQNQTLTKKLLESTQLNQTCKQTNQDVKRLISMLECNNNFEQESTRIKEQHSVQLEKLQETIKRYETENKYLSNQLSKKILQLDEKGVQIEKLRKAMNEKNQLLQNRQTQLMLKENIGEKLITSTILQGKNQQRTLIVEAIEKFTSQEILRSEILYKYDSQIKGVAQYLQRKDPFIVLFQSATPEQTKIFGAFSTSMQQSTFIFGFGQNGQILTFEDQNQGKIQEPKSNTAIKKALKLSSVKLEGLRSLTYGSNELKIKLNCMNEVQISPNQSIEENYYQEIQWEKVLGVSLKELTDLTITLKSSEIHRVEFVRGAQSNKKNPGQQTE